MRGDTITPPSCVQGGILTGNLGTRFPRNLHTQPKYFVGVPLFDKICIDMNLIEQKRIKKTISCHIIDTSGELSPLRWFQNSIIHAYLGEIFGKGREFPQSKFYYPRFHPIHYDPVRLVNFIIGKLHFHYS